MRARLSGFLVPLAIAAGCATPPPAASPPPGCAGDAATVLACVRAREDAVRSLRARFRATTRRQGESHATNGVLLVSKPDRFRLRLMLPFGLTVFDYTRDGRRSAVSLPLRGPDNQGADDGAPPFGDIDLAEAFLRGEYAFPGACSAEEDGAHVRVACRDGDGRLLRELVLDPASGTIASEVSHDGERPRLALAYSEYRVVDGAVLPFRIDLAYPQRGVALAIEIEHYQVNPDLGAALFRPVELE